MQAPLKLFVKIIGYSRKVGRQFRHGSAGEKVLLELFQKLTVSRSRASCRTPQSAKSFCLFSAGKVQENPRRGFS